MNRIRTNRRTIPLEAAPERVFQRLVNGDVGDKERIMKWSTVACLVALPLALGCANGRAARSNVAAEPVQVTKTWQDLLDQPVISLEKGTARLGIEASGTPRRSGILIYCLTQGYSLPRECKETHRLGPFKIEVQHEDDEAEKAGDVCQMAWNNPPDISQSIALFRRSIPLDRPGKFCIRVLSLDDELVGQAVVTATPEAYHPWMPFELSHGAGLEKSDDRFEFVAHVRNRAKGIAIPRFEGMQPLLFRSAGPERKVQRLVGEKLPTLFPTDSPSGRDDLTVRAAGTDLIVESRESLVLARPDWHFLVRWWVNGNPYIPEQLDSFEDANGLVITGKKLLLHLDFLPRRIGAKQGDEVEPQLLYCKSGWELVQPMEKLSACHDMEGPELLLSNRVRIEWETDRNRQPEN